MNYSDFIEFPADVSAMMKSSRWTPLHLAVVDGCIGNVRLLLANGADVNARRKDSKTPLHLAVERGYVDIAEVLLANGADVNAKHRGQTPLHLATRLLQHSLIQLLTRHDAHLDASSHMQASASNPRPPSTGPGTPSATSPTRTTPRCVRATFPEMVPYYSEMKVRGVQVDLDTAFVLLSRAARYDKMDLTDVFALYDELTLLGARSDAAVAEVLHTVWDHSAGLDADWRESRRRQLVDLYNSLALEEIRRLGPRGYDKLMLQQLGRYRSNLKALGSTLRHEVWAAA